MSASASPSFVSQQVRRFDGDRFATAMFAAAEHRQSLFALYAFNIQVAQIRELVHEPLLGQIRLQWWRDTIKALGSGGSVAHPVAEALEDAFRLHGLSAWPFERLLDAREADMEDQPPFDLAALESYAEGTSSTINAIALEILGVQDQSADRAARHLGIAWAMTGLLRAVPFHASAGRLYLPCALLDGQGVAVQEVLAGRPSPGLAKVGEAVAERAFHHLAEARRYRRDVPRAALPAMLTAPLADSYLGSLAKVKFDLFAPAWSAHRSQPLKLLWSAARGRY